MPSWPVPNDTDRRRRETIASSPSHERRIEIAEPFKLPIKMPAKAVIAVQLLNQFEDDAGAEGMQPLDLPLAAKTS